MMKESLLTLHQLIELIFSTQSMKSLDATNHGHHWPGDSIFSLRHALGGDMGHVPRRGYVCSTNLFEYEFFDVFFSPLLQLLISVQKHLQAVEDLTI